MQNVFRVRLFLYAYLPSVSFCIPRVSNILSATAALSAVFNINNKVYKCLDKFFQWCSKLNQKSHAVFSYYQIFFLIFVIYLAVYNAHAAHASLLRGMRGYALILGYVPIFSFVQDSTLKSLLFFSHFNTMHTMCNYYTKIHQESRNDFSLQWFFLGFILTISSAVMRGCQAGSVLQGLYSGGLQMFDKLRSHGIGSTTKQNMFDISWAFKVPKSLTQQKVSDTQVFKETTSLRKSETPGKRA